MGFSEAISAGFKGYVDFQGRSQRSAYWYWTLFTVIVSIVLSVIGVAIFGEAGSLLANLWSLVVLLPGIAVGIRRLHDLDRSGWWLLLALIPLIGGLVLLYWFCCKGTDGDNRFGADPLA